MKEIKLDKIRCTHSYKCMNNEWIATELTPIQSIVITIQAYLGLDDDGLARQLGVSGLTVWRWKTHRAEPRGIRLARLMRLWEANGGEQR